MRETRQIGEKFNRGRTNCISRGHWKITSLNFPTFWFEATPQGKFMLSVACGPAKYYTDNLRENILRGLGRRLGEANFRQKRRSDISTNPVCGLLNPTEQLLTKWKTFCGLLPPEITHLPPFIAKCILLAWLAQKAERKCPYRLLNIFWKIHFTKDIFFTAASFIKEAISQWLQRNFLTKYKKR